MAVLGFLDAIAQDDREQLSTDITTQSSEYCFRINDEESVPCLPEEFTLGVGDTAWWFWRMYITTWSSMTVDFGNIVAWANGARNGAILTNPRCLLVLDEDRYARLWGDDNNGGGNYSTESYQIPTGTWSDYCMELTVDSSTQMTGKLYVWEAGAWVQKLSAVCTNAGGLGTLTFKSFLTGLNLSGTGLPKGATVLMYTRAMKVHDSSGSGAGAAMPTTTSLFHAALPNADPEEAEWLTQAAGTGTYTTVDDALGTVITTRDDDYNESTSTTLEKDQAYGFPAGPSPATPLAVSFCVDGISTESAAATKSVVLDDGTESEKDVSFGVAGFPVGTLINFSGRRIWTAMPGGGAFTAGNITSANFKARHEAAGSAWNWQNYSAIRVIYYEPSAPPAGGARSQVIMI